MVSNVASMQNLSMEMVDVNEMRELGMEVDNIVKAVVTEINGDKIKIKFENENLPDQEISAKELKVSTLDIKVGDKVFFEVKTVNKNKVELKPIKIKTDVIDNRNTMRVDMLKSMLSKINIDITKESMQIADEIDKNDMEITQKTFAQTQTLKNDISKIVNNITKNKIEILRKNEISLDKVTMEILVENLKEAYSGKDIEVKNLEVKVEKSFYNKIKVAEESTTDMKNNIKTILENNDLPETKENVKYIRNILNQLSEVKEIKQADILEIIKRDDNITLEGLYKAKYTSGSQTASGLKRKEKIDEILNIDAEIAKILNAQNIEANSDNKALAKAFYNNGIDIIADNIKEYKIIENSVRNIDEVKVIDEAIRNIKTGSKNIYLDENIEKLNNEKMQQKLMTIKESIENVDISDIKRVIEKRQTINIKNIVNEGKISENTITSILNNPQIDIKALKVKLQMEEIRLKLTVEAAMKLKDKGINIETDPIKKVVDELKRMEEQVDIIIGEQKITVDIGKADTMKTLYEKIDILKTRDMDTYANAIKNKIFLNIENLSNEILNNSNKMEKMVENSNNYVDNYEKNGKEAENGKSIHNMEKIINSMLNAYEEAETRPNIRYGDSVKKIENQIENLLKSQNIDASEINVKCSKILIKNNMEVNNENIEAIKVCENKVQAVTRGLHPVISLDMISQNKNPIEMHLDEVIQYIGDFNGKYGLDTQETLYDSIATMEEKKTINLEQKDALISIYKAMNKINKAGDVAVGLAIKKDISLTINNLLEATKYIQTTKVNDENINMTIDDNFGILSEIKNNEKSIMGKIQRILDDADFGFTKDNKNLIQAMENVELDTNNENIYKAYNAKSILNELKKLATPEKLQHIISNNLNINNTPIGEIVEKLKEATVEKTRDFGYSDEKINKFLKDIEGLEGTSENVLYALKKYDIKSTINNINLLKKFEKDFNFLSKEYKEIDNVIKNENLETKTMFRDNLNNLKDKLLGKRKNDNSIDNLESIKQEYSSKEGKSNDTLINKIEKTQEILKAAQNIHKQDEFYQIPIYLGDRLTNLNIYMYNDKNQNQDSGSKNEKNVLVSMDTETLGDVSIDIKIKARAVEIKINAENKQDREFVRQNLGELQRIIQELGYKTDKISWQNQKLTNPIFNEINNEIRKYKNSKYEETV
ncbi:MAG TPA: hypothetical protein DEP72_05010 [Clostridiales bacterium]|nr:MAG: hypothetical protein A2Y18_02110 [Clostridiales bacterium GWD2_32_19]HCC07500.1 hypothetical protein [Clostridiales bacterium]